MKKRTGSEKNDLLYEYLKTLCICYSSGYFELLFPLLSDDVVQESMWVLTPNVGNNAVKEYFLGKGETLRQHQCCPECAIVQLVGHLHYVDADKLYINGKETQSTRFGLYYPDGKLCMLMRQTLNGKTNAVIVDLTLNDDNKIERIDLCDPALYEFVPYNGISTQY